jgi:hypothetical protein
MEDLNLDFVVIETHPNGKPSISVNDISIVASFDNKPGSVQFKDTLRPLTTVEAALVAALRVSKAKELKSAPGEPFFVLLGRDPQAPDLVEIWAKDRNAMGYGGAKTESAKVIASNMRVFKEANPDLGLGMDSYRKLAARFRDPQDDLFIP